MSIKLICASHTPLMDHVETDPLVDATVRQHFQSLAGKVREFDPELIIIFAPDHFKGFFYDLLPPFTVGVRATAIGDYDIGSGDYVVPEDDALSCIRFLHRSGVDVAMSYRMQVDHGFSQLLMLLTGDVSRYRVLPVHVNCAGPPLPTFARVRALGHAVGAWAAGQSKRILILGSGGLSHDPPIPKLRNAPPPVVEKLIAGRNPPIAERRAREQQNFETARALARGEGIALPLSPDWDKALMNQLDAGNLAGLDGLSEDELTRVAGCGGHEVRTWIAAYAALAASGPYVSNQLFYHDISEWNAGMGIAEAQPVHQLARSSIESLSAG